MCTVQTKNYNIILKVKLINKIIIFFDKFISLSDNQF